MRSVHGHIMRLRVIVNRYSRLLDEHCGLSKGREVKLDGNNLLDEIENELAARKGVIDHWGLEIPEQKETGHGT